MTHDKFCPWFNGWPEASSCLFCDSLAKARADERERAADLVLRLWPWSEGQTPNAFGWIHKTLVHLAAAVVNGEDPEKALADFYEETAIISCGFAAARGEDKE